MEARRQDDIAALTADVHPRGNSSSVLDSLRPKGEEQMPAAAPSQLLNRVWQLSV
jgi:hypothetical protein